MGCYVNPRNMSKEAWLECHGDLTEGPCEITETHLPVCLVQNRGFTAAGVAFSADEVEAFSSPDPRTKIWYKVSRELLRTASDLSIFERPAGYTNPFVKTR